MLLLSHITPTSRHFYFPNDRLQIARPEEFTMSQDRILQLPQANRLRIHRKEDNGRNNNRQRST
jgi:hypothetical protein